MTKVTPENALALSIAKWDRLSRARKVPDEPGSDNCPLCRIYFSSPTWCGGCPVSARTGQNACGGTPYGKAHSAWWNWSNNPTPENAQAFRDAAKAEADFLRSLAEATP